MGIALAVRSSTLHSDCTPKRVNVRLKKKASRGQNVRAMCAHCAAHSVVSAADSEQLFACT